MAASQLPALRIAGSLVAPRLPSSPWLGSLVAPRLPRAPLVVSGRLPSSLPWQLTRVAQERLRGAGRRGHRGQAQGQLRPAGQGQGPLAREPTRPGQRPLILGEPAALPARPGQAGSLLAKLSQLSHPKGVIGITCLLRCYYDFKRISLGFHKVLGPLGAS